MSALMSKGDINLGIYGTSVSICSRWGQPSWWGLALLAVGGTSAPGWGARGQAADLKRLLAYSTTGKHGPDHAGSRGKHLRDTGAYGPASSPPQRCCMIAHAAFKSPASMAADSLAATAARPGPARRLAWPNAGDHRLFRVAALVWSAVGRRVG